MLRAIALLMLVALVLIAANSCSTLSAGEQAVEPDAPQPEPVEMVVHGIRMDPVDKVPVVVLMTPDKSLALPIQIGPAEAAAIWRYINDLDAPRPMTHDLLASVIRKLGGTVEKNTVTDLKEGTFYARIDISVGEGLDERTIRIDARPSDSIALAAQSGLKIFVAKKVLDVAGRKPGDGDGPETDEPEPEREPRGQTDEAI